MSIDPRIERIIGRFNKAQRYAEIDPEVALSEARKTAEAVCKFVYTEHGSQNPTEKEFKKPVDKMMLNGLAMVLERHKLVPRVVSTSVRTIQAFGNLGAHDQGEEADQINQESIQSCITATTTLVKWFLGDRGLDMSLLDGQAGEITDGGGVDRGLTRRPQPAAPAGSAPKGRIEFRIGGVLWMCLYHFCTTTRAKRGRPAPPRTTSHRRRPPPTTAAVRPPQGRVHYSSSTNEIICKCILPA
jgi:hypothetical protein